MKLPERTGAAGIGLIKQFEGLRLSKYRDAVGLWTIGYGHLIGQSERFDRPLSRGEADSLLRADLRSAERAVRQLVRYGGLTQSQFDALVSFVFNLGAGRLRQSTLLRYLNVGNVPHAAEQFMVWDKAGGKVLPGLTRRRHAERSLFLEA
ncbi:MULTISPECIES: lysozyme [unclassified Paludibacterium]|uniref:lysozyme n=1 Tax=unclassified Paludibacterium TaxID=2618429 RepID=UPI001C05A9A6|nr:lysozyme [Paludibacterium sp. B53371]BEV73013.1 lysozyme [Paludibacterium sp. THUN1379]